MSKQERLKKALAEIKNLPDAYFDALMQEMGLSTDRTFPDQTDTPIVYTAPKGLQNARSEKDTEIAIRKTAVFRLENEGQTFLELKEDILTSFRQNRFHSKTRYTTPMNTIIIVNFERWSLVGSHYQKVLSTPSMYAPKVQTQKQRTVSANLEHSSAVLSTKRWIPTA